MTIDNQNFNNSLNEFKNIKLDANVKEDIKSKLLLHIKKPVASDAPTIPVIASPYFSYMSVWEKYSKVAILCVFVLSFGTAFAASPSLPGDVLYPIKTRIVEPVVKFAQLNKDAEIKYEASLATKRIAELEQLKTENRLTEERVQENKVLFQENLAVLESYKQERPESMALDGVIDLDASIFKYSGIVATLASTSNTATVMATTTSTSSNPILAAKYKGKKKINLVITSSTTTTFPALMKSTITIPVNNNVHASTSINTNINLPVSVPVNIPVNIPVSVPTNIPVTIPAIQTPVIQTPSVPVNVVVPKVGL